MFFKELKLAALTIISAWARVSRRSHGEQTGEMLVGIEHVLIKELPDLVLVCGDQLYDRWSACSS